MAKYSIVVTEVVQTGPYSLRVGFGGINREKENSFSAVPYLVSSHPNNALRKELYIVKDSSSNVKTIKDVKTVPDYFNCVELVMASELELGTYTLDIDLTLAPIENYAGMKVECLNFGFPTLYKFGSFQCKYMSPQAKQTTLEDNFRKYMSPVLDGPNFRSLIAALVSGEKYNADNYKSAHDQLFVNTASSPYLERLGSNYGIYQSQNAEMDDDTFRHYVQTFYNKKITEDALYSMIEVFYGITSTRAYSVSDSASLDFVTEGENLFYFIFDGVKHVYVTIKDTEFTYQTNENAAVLIDRKLKEQQVNAHCDIDLNGKVRLFSDTKGLRSSVEVVSCPSWISFVEGKKFALYSNPNPAYIGRDGDGYMQIFIPVIADLSQGRTASNATYSDSDVIQTVDQEYYPTGKYSTLAKALPAGTHDKIEVADGTPFELDSNKTGFVFVGYGYGFQVGPVEYTVVGTKLMFKTPLVVTNFIPVGVEVNVAQLVSESTNVSAQVDPSIAAGLLKQTLVDMIDVGIKYRINIYYPETTGLSDPTGIWGG